MRRGCCSGTAKGPWPRLEQARQAVADGVKEGRRKVILQADGDVPHGEVVKVAGAVAQVEGITVHRRRPGTAGQINAAVHSGPERTERSGIGRPSMEGPLASWDVFHGDRLELERGLTTAAIREALASGELRDDDLVRPAGTTVAWTRLADMPELLETCRALPPNRRPPPARIRSAQTARHPRFAPSSAPGDFRGPGRRRRANVALPRHDPPSAPRTGSSSGPRSDDVAFPVIKDSPPVPEPEAVDQAPARGRDRLSPDGWLWAEEVDDDEEDGDYEECDRSRRRSRLLTVSRSLLETLTPSSTSTADRSSRRMPRDVDAASQTSRVALPVVASGGWDETGMAAEAERRRRFLAVAQRAGDRRRARPGTDGRRGLSARVVLHGDRDDGPLQDARDPQAEHRTGADGGRPGSLARKISRTTISWSRSIRPAP